MQKPNTIEIPPIFRNHLTGDYLDRCISCDTYLLAGGIPYFIEKAVRQYPGFSAADALFEYAICMDCALKMRQELSKISLERIEQYFEQRVNVWNRYQTLSAQTSEDPQQWLSHCMITGKPMSALSEYQIFAQCEGKSLILTGMPYMLSGEVLDEISELLSDQSRGEINRFIDEHFGIPPELKEPLKDQPFLLL